MVLNLGEEAALRVMLTLTACVTVLKTDRCGFTSALGGNGQTCVVDVQSLTSSIRRRVTSSQSPQMLDDDGSASGCWTETPDGFRTDGASLSAAGCHSG